MSELKKFKNQLNELKKRNSRIANYVKLHKKYSEQYERVNSKLNKLREKDENGNISWKKNLNDENGEYNVVYFQYPSKKVYKLTKDKLRNVSLRLSNEKRYLRFLENKINRNKF